MSKFNRGAQPLPRVARASSPLSTVVNPQLSSTLIVPDTTTHEGGDGFRRDSRTALFLACTSSFITENSFYETGDERTNRVVELTHAVAPEEGGLEWLLNFVTWLRGPEGNIRTAAIVVAAEAVRGLHLARASGAYDRISQGAAGSATEAPETLRRLVAAALQRADEPGEMIAYWTASAWEAIIPSMGYMALLRNLRNFDEAGPVSDAVAAQVAPGSPTPSRSRSPAAPVPVPVRLPAAPSRPVEAHARHSTYRNVGRVGLYMFADRAAKHSVTVGGSVLNEMAQVQARGSARSATARRSRCRPCRRSAPATTG
jgi:hypothetical protein